MSMRVLRNTLRRSIPGNGGGIESRKRAALLGAVAALGFLLFSLSPASAQVVVLFEEDFEGFALGSNISGQAGWFGGGGGTVLVGTGNLGTQLAQGRTPRNGLFNAATHAVGGIGTTRVTTLTYRGFAFPGSPSVGSHNSGVYFSIGSFPGLSPAAGWVMFNAPWRTDRYKGPSWFFDVRGLTGLEESLLSLQEFPGRFDVPVSLTVVLDPLNEEVFGIIDGIETTHVSATAAQIAAVNGVFIFQDQREGSGGAEFDNILVTSIPHTVPFTFSTAKVEIEEAALEVKGTFTLGAGTDGIAPLTEIVALQLSGGSASLSITIPAGSFKCKPPKPGKKGKPGKPEQCAFEGVIDGVALEAKITPLDADTVAAANTFEFKAEADGADLTGIANPVTVSLTVGDDGGNTTVEAEFE